MAEVSGAQQQHVNGPAAPQNLGAGEQSVFLQGWRLRSVGHSKIHKDFLQEVSGYAEWFLGPT